MKTDFRADTILYNRLLEGCAQLASWEKGLKVLKEMDKANIKPCNFTLSTLRKLGWQSRCPLDTVFGAGDMIAKKNSIRLNVHLFGTFVNACVSCVQRQRLPKFAGALGAAVRTAKSGESSDDIAVELTRQLDESGSSRCAMATWRSLDVERSPQIGQELTSWLVAKNFDGTLIEDLRTVEHFTEIFESYAMQKQLSVTILSFGFPCAFLVPFLMEPVVSIFLPYTIMPVLVGWEELKGNSAEGYLGRYGDIMIIVILVSMILWFPSGFNMTMFTFLTCSHVYLYVYDHMWKLRSVASIYISSYSGDWWAQRSFSIPCAIIVGALTFELNCEPYLDEYFTGMELDRLHGQDWGTHCNKGLHVWIKVVISIFGHIVAMKVCCPEECPLFVDDFLTTGTIGDFACVGDSIQSCKERNPVTTVADPKTDVCRRCNVVGCHKCRSDSSERCESCLEGYPLEGNGRCGYT